MITRRAQALPADLRELLHNVIEAADANPEFAAILKSEFGTKRKAKKTSSRHRRPRGPIDPFAVRDTSGAAGLKGELGKLDIDQLKDIVAEHGMDPGKLAMKWKTSDRLVDLIADTVETRRRKGSAFRD